MNNGMTAGNIERTDPPPFQIHTIQYYFLKTFRVTCQELQDTLLLSTSFCPLFSLFLLLTLIPAG